MTRTQTTRQADRLPTAAPMRPHGKARRMRAADARSRKLAALYPPSGLYVVSARPDVRFEHDTTGLSDRSYGDAVALRDYMIRRGFAAATIYPRRRPAPVAVYGDILRECGHCGRLAGLCTCGGTS